MSSHKYTFGNAYLCIRSDINSVRRTVFRSDTSYVVYMRILSVFIILMIISILRCVVLLWLFYGYLKGVVSQNRKTCFMSRINSFHVFKSLLREPQKNFLHTKGVFCSGKTVIICFADYVMLIFCVLFPDFILSKFCHAEQCIFMHF